MQIFFVLQRNTVDKKRKVSMLDKIRVDIILTDEARKTFSGKISVSLNLLSYSFSSSLSNS